MKKHTSTIDEQIRQAMEDGQFDNLPGKGEPINLSMNPHEDPAWRLAFQALRSSGYTLPWIDKRRQIEADFTAAKESLARAWKWYQDACVDEGLSPDFVEPEWQRSRAVFHQKIEEINERIFSYNLDVPSDQFQRRKIDVENEIHHIVSEADVTEAD